MNDDLREFSEAARQVAEGLGPEADEEQGWALVKAAEALLQDGLVRATAGNYEFRPGPESRRAGLAAMHMASEAYSEVAEESLQLHGGIGMTAEHLCHRYLKRSLLEEHLGRARDNYELALADGILASA